MLRRTLPKLAVLSCLVAAPAAAAASDGAAGAPTYGGAGYGELGQPTQSVDRNPAQAEQKPKPEPKQPKDAPTASGSGGRPLLTTFGVSASRMYLFGHAARINFQINDAAATVTVRLVVIDSTTGTKVRTIELG